MTIIPTISSAMSDMYSDSCICCGFTTTCTCVCYTCNHVPDTFNAHLYVHEHPGHLCPALDGVVVHGVVHCVHGMVVCDVVCGVWYNNLHTHYNSFFLQELCKDDVATHIRLVEHYSSAGPSNTSTIWVFSWIPHCGMLISKLL